MEQQLSLDWSGASNDQGWPADAVIYFVEAPSTGLVKIGFTTNLKARLYSLRGGGGAAVVMRLVKAIPGSRRVEAAMHRRFKAHRVRGEWFTLAPIRAEIEAITASVVLADVEPVATCLDCGLVVMHKSRRCRACCFAHRGVMRAARHAVDPKRSHQKKYAPGEVPALACQACGTRLGAQARRSSKTGLCHSCRMTSVWQTPEHREKMLVLSKARRKPCRHCGTTEPPVKSGSSYHPDCWKEARRVRALAQPDTCGNEGVFAEGG